MSDVRRLRTYTDADYRVSLDLIVSPILKDVEISLAI